MKFSILFSDALTALTRNKKRSILTMLGIIIGIGAVIAIISIGKGFENFVVGQLTNNEDNEITSNIIFQPKDMDLYYDSNIEFFRNYEISEIKKISGVKDVKFAQNEESNDEANLGIQSNRKSENSRSKLVENTDMDIIEGRNINSVDNKLKNRVLIIDKNVAERLFDKKDSYIGKSVDINGLNYEIVGVYSGGFGMMGMMDYSVYLPKNTYNFYNKSKDNNPSITLYLESGASVSDVSKEVVNYLSENGSMKNYGSYSFFDMGEIMDGISNILDNITKFIALIGGISLFIAGIGMMNMMYISVSERTKEIGIRRALGATKKNITMQFLLEGVVITVIGGILGYIFGLILAFMISAFLPFTAAIEAGPIFIALSISLIIGVVFSYSPAKSAANKNVIEILT